MSCRVECFLLIEGPSSVFGFNQKGKHRGGGALTDFEIVFHYGGGLHPTQNSPEEKLIFPILLPCFTTVE